MKGLRTLAAPITLLFALLGSAPSAAASGPAFPRLLGMEIGTSHYLAPKLESRILRLNIVILNFWRGQRIEGHRMGYVVRTLKYLAPHLVIGQYTIMDAAYKGSWDPAQADIAAKLTREDWWLRGPGGHRIQLAAVNHNYQTNFTRFTRKDAQGQRYPQWLAARDDQLFFQKAPFDLWFFDDVGAKERGPRADWHGDGVRVSSAQAAIQHAYRAGQAAEWAAARALAPHLLFMGNADNDLHYPTYRGKLQGAFLEGLMGRSWSLATWAGWDRMMRRYRDVFANLAPPKLVGFNVAGNPKNYRFFRFAFTSCLMDNGYFSFTDKKHLYATLPWFDEYNITLGYPLDPPQRKPWRHGVYRRRFQDGVALVNPTDQPETVTVHGYRHFLGGQDPRVNNGRPVTRVRLAPRDGVVLVDQGP
jgi:hypothetical protein